MKTILEHLSRFDTEGYTEPPPPEIPPLPPIPLRSRVLYDNMSPGQYGYSAETSRRPIVSRCPERQLPTSSYRGRSFWVDLEYSVPEISAAPAPVPDPAPTPENTLPPSPLWYDPAMWPEQLGPPMNLDFAYASILDSATTAAESRREALLARLETEPPYTPYGNPTQWTWTNRPPTPEPNAQS